MLLLLCLIDIVNIHQLFNKTIQNKFFYYKRISYIKTQLNYIIEIL